MSVEDLQYTLQDLDHRISNHVRCFARSVEYLQYTLADVYLVSVDCLDSGLQSLPKQAHAGPLGGLSPYLCHQCYRAQ